MSYYKLVLIALLFTASYTTSAKTVKVLFIGNSYTYSNDIPLMLKQLATANGDTLVYDQYVPGGYTLEWHSTDNQAIAKIQSDKWDIVVLQEQSQKPAFHPGDVAADVYPYARILDSIIKDNHACTETMFYMTWGRKNGDAANCASYPPVCTYAGMQQRLRESYMEMAQDNNGLTAPVGAAWKVVRDSIPAMELYVPDESHPSVHGSYLAACVFYASVFHKSPHGNSFVSSLSATDAERLQYFAAKVTLDSLKQWQQHGNYVYAGFWKGIPSTNDWQRDFVNNSLNATTYHWDFGDGHTSTAKDPSHSYISPGVFNVTLTASNDCFTEVHTDTVKLATVGISEATQAANAVTVSQAGGGQLTFHIPSGYQSFSIYTISGSKVATKNLNGNPVSLTQQLTPGIYIYTVEGKQRQSGKLSVN